MSCFKYISYPQNFCYFHFILGMINHSPIYLNDSPDKPQDQEKENGDQGGDTENVFEESDSFFGTPEFCDANDWTFEFTGFETPQPQEMETPQPQEIDSSQTQKLDNDHRHTLYPSDIQSSSLDNNQNFENHNNFRQYNFQYPAPLLIQPQTNPMSSDQFMRQYSKLLTGNENKKPSKKMVLYWHRIMLSHYSYDIRLRVPDIPHLKRNISRYADKYFDGFAHVANVILFYIRYLISIGVINYERDMQIMKEKEDEKKRKKKDPPNFN